MYKEAIQFHKTALPIFLGICLLIFLMGCGQRVQFRSNSCTVDVDQNKIVCPDGTEINLPKDGTDGVDGADAVLHTEIVALTPGACYNVAPGLYVENEGSHADVYNNASCDHNPAPKEALCNNIYEQEVCPVDNYLIYIEDSYSDMIIHVLEFN